MHVKGLLIWTVYDDSHGRYYVRVSLKCWMNRVTVPFIQWSEWNRVNEWASVFSWLWFSCCKSTLISIRWLTTDDENGYLLIVGSKQLDQITFIQMTCEQSNGKLRYYRFEPSSSGSDGIFKYIELLNRTKYVIFDMCQKWKNACNAIKIWPTMGCVESSSKAIWCVHWTCDREWDS